MHFQCFFLDSLGKTKYYEKKNLTYVRMEMRIQLIKE